MFVCLNRERSIFECMIANLFDEYKFYPRYPEHQLKIAGVAFGKFIFRYTVNGENLTQFFLSTILGFYYNLG